MILPRNGRSLLLWRVFFDPPVFPHEQGGREGIGLAFVVAADLADHGRFRRVPVAESNEEITIGDAEQHLSGDTAVPRSHQIRQQHPRRRKIIICGADRHRLVAGSLHLVRFGRGTQPQIFQSIFVDVVERSGRIGMNLSIISALK